jgi:YVTN family beta-propeller protein
MAEQDVLLVVQKGDHSLGYYDPASGRELARVEVDPFPHEFSLSGDGRRAYLACFGVALAEHGGPGGNTVAVVDVPSRRRIGTIGCGDYRRPHDVVCDAAGRAYILSEATSHLLVAEDPASGRFDRVLPTRGRGSHMVSVLRDGSVAFTSNMESGDVTALFPRDPGRPGVLLPAGQHPEGSVLDAEEARLFVVNRESAEITVVDVKRLAVVETIPTPPGPVRICRDPRGRLLVALYHGKGLLILDERDVRAQRVVPLPEKAISVGYHEASRTAFLSTHAHCVCAVDVDAGRLVHSIPTRLDPDPVRVVRLEI